MDAASENAGVVFYPPKTGNINSINFLVGTVTTAPTENHDCRIETVDAATGLNTGTLWAANTNATILLDTTGWKSVTLTASAAVTLGTPMAAMIVAPATNFGSIRISSFADDTPSRSVPYGISVAADTTNVPIIVVGYDDGSYAYVPSVWPISAINTRTFNNGSAIKRRGLRFQVAAPMRLAYAWIWQDADGDYDLVFYAANGTTPTTVMSFDKDIRGSVSAPFAAVPLTAKQTLVANTFYRLVIVPTTATSMSVYDFDVNVAGLLDATQGGQNFHLTTATGVPAAEGDWTQTLTAQPFMGLGFDQIDDGVAGGGLRLAGHGGLAA